MSRLFDYAAGLSGCTTDMQCEQLAAIYAMGAALAFIGVLCIAAGALQAWQAGRYRQQARRL